MNVDDILNQANIDYENAITYKLDSFIEFIGNDVIAQIKDSIASAIINKPVIRQPDGYYKCTFDIKELDITNVDKSKSSFYIKNYPKTDGIPLDLLLKCINTHPRINIFNIQTIGLSQIYSPSKQIITKNCVGFVCMLLCCLPCMVCMESSHFILNFNNKITIRIVIYFNRNNQFQFYPKHNQSSDLPLFHGIASITDSLWRLPS